jgi:hypothetical protein
MEMSPEEMRWRLLHSQAEHDMNKALALAARYERICSVVRDHLFPQMPVEDLEPEAVHNALEALRGKQSSNT